MNHPASKIILARLSIASAVISLLCLLLLHFVSPEFDPAWRMVSEYAFGNHEWLLTSFFIFWGTSSFFIILLVWDMVTTRWAKFGVLLLCLSFLGQIMGGVFDIKHKLHGLAFLLGVPFFPVAALLVSYYFIRKDSWRQYKVSVLFSTHFTWISLVFMVVSMILMISGFQKAGVPMGEGIAPPKSVPDGVIAVNGYANRILIFAYIYWLMLIAKTYLKVENKKN